MADTSTIEWTDSTWNPITGCTLVSEGCRHCYAATLAATRLKNHPSRKGLARINAAGEAKFTGEVRFNEQWIDQPLRWKRPRMIFVCAHGDLFHEAVPDEWIDRVFAVMALAQQHTFQVLTKRPERARAYLVSRNTSVPGDMITNTAFGMNCRVRGYRGIGGSATWPLPNVWLGTSIEDQATADARIPHLLATPAAVRFVSAEPLLGPVYLTRVGNFQSVTSAFPELVERLRRHMRPHTISGVQIEAVGSRYQATTFYQTPDHMGGFEVGSREYPRLNWVIVGGESGRNARPMHPDWARSLRDQCVAAGVAFFFKQWGAWVPWEMGSAPMWNAQNGASEDGNWLFPSDMDADATWDDGLAHYEPGRTEHCAFQSVGKKAAGRLLDGRVWNQMPGVVA